jgi:biopolymer transport protein ExbD
MNLTPMIDVVMLLNIFFMVGSRLVEPEKQYEINLPTVTDARPLTGLPDEIIVNVKDDGTIFVKGKQIEPDQLEANLKAAAKRYSDQIVRIRGDGEGPYQHVMSTLSLCQRAGISRIKLDARIEAPSAP